MGTVFRGRWNGRDVAIKQLNERSNKTAKAMGSVIAEEVLVQNGLSHRNIVQMFGFSKKANQFLIVSELMDKSLDSFLYPVDDDGEDMPCVLTLEEKSSLRKKFVGKLKPI